MSDTLIQPLESVSYVPNVHLLDDYYMCLELTRNASLVDVKKAFRRIVLQVHPDRNPQDHSLGACFAKVCEAYDVLINRTKKLT